MLSPVSGKAPAAAQAQLPTETAAGPSRSTAVNPAVIRQQAQRAAPSNRAEQERLFQQFMQWSKQRQE